MTSQRFKLAVLASGRGSNFRVIAQSCHNDHFPAEVACLITGNSDAEAIAIADEFSVPWHFVDAGARRGRLQDGAEESIVAICQQAGVELIVLAGFMRILRGPLLENFSGRIINIHPSLLPSFPGLRAEKQALAYGARVSGATVHYVDDSVDGGPIILQDTVTIEDHDTEDTLKAKIRSIEHRLLPQTIELIARGRVRVNGRRVEQPTEHDTRNV